MALRATLLVREDGWINSTTPSLDTANVTLFSDGITTATPDDNPLADALLSLGWLVLLFYCCCPRKVPDERYWRGRQLRELALLERQRHIAQEARDNQSPLERKRGVQQAMITKVRRGSVNVVT
jgi:hypothetical protein